MNALLHSVLDSRITSSDLVGLTVADLESLRSSATFLVPSKGAAAWFGHHPNIKRGSFTPDEIKIITTRYSEMSTGRVLRVGGFEQVCWDNHMTVLYQPKEITVTSLDGTQQIYTAGCVPIKKPRLGAARLSVFYCSLFHLKGGELCDIIDYPQLHKRFQVAGSAIDVRDFARVKLTFRAAMMAYSPFRAAVHEETTVQGNFFLDMVINAFQSCAWTDYFALHDVVCVRFLRAVQFVENKDKTLTLTGRLGSPDKTGNMVPLVPDSSILMIDYEWAKTKMNEEALEALLTYNVTMGHWPIFLIGPVHTKHSFPGVSTTFKGAYSSYATGDRLRGSQYSGMGMFLQNAGFSSMSSAAHNKMCLLVAMASNSLRQGCERVCIWVSSGQIVVVDSSLRSIFPKHEWNRFCYVLEKGERGTVPDHLQDKLEATCPPEAHIIRIFDAVPEAVGMTVDPTVKFDTAATVIRRQLDNVRGYTIYCSICSPLFWGIGDDKFLSKMPPPHVFQFRAPFDMRGIVTTLKAVKLAEEKECAQVMTPEDWCRRIGACNAHANLYFLKPVTFFSTISNLLKPEFKTLGLFDKDTDGWTYSSANESDMSFMSDFVLPEATPLVPNSAEVKQLLADRKLKLELTNMISTVLPPPVPPTLPPPKFVHRTPGDENPKSFSLAKQEHYSKKKPYVKEKKIFKEKEKEKEKEREPEVKEKYEPEKKIKVDKAEKPVTKDPPVTSLSSLSVVQAVNLDGSSESDLVGGEADSVEDAVFG